MRDVGVMMIVKPLVKASGETQRPGYTSTVASHVTFSKGDCRHHDLSPRSGGVSRPSLAAAKGKLVA